MLWFVLAGCDQKPPTDTDTDPPPDCTDVAYETHAERFVETCRGCHSADLEGEQRNGAPDGLNFDPPGGVEGFAAQMVALGTGPDARMPPFGLDDDTRERFALWVECGLPGLPQGCVGQTLDADLAVSEVPADLCPTTRWLTGDLRVDGPTDGVSCLCGVGGDLIVEADTTLPELARVDGLLSANGTTSTRIELPQLHTVGGAIELEANAELTTVDLQRLREAGRVRIRDNAALTTVQTGRLATVGGSLVIRDNEALEALDLSALLEVDGPIDLRDNASLASLETPGALTTLPDSLELTNLPGLDSVSGFGALQTVAGAVRMEALQVDSVVAFPALASAGSVQVLGFGNTNTLHAFQSLETVSGTLRVADMAPVQNLDVFGAVRQIDGSLVIDDFRSQAIIGFPSLETVSGTVDIVGNPVLSELRLPNLTSVGGIVVRTNPQLPDLAAFSGITTVPGTVEIHHNQQMTSLNGLHNVTSVQGSLRIEGLSQLSDLSALDALQEVRGDLRVVDLDQFELTEIEAAFADVLVLGTVTLEP